MAAFLGNKKIKSLFAPFLAKLKLGQYQKIKRQRIILIIDKKGRLALLPFRWRFLSTGEAGEIGYCLGLANLKKTPFVDLVL